MNHWLIRIAIFLILGAMINVAVAWGSAIFVPVWRGVDIPEIGDISTGTQIPYWLVEGRRTPTAVRLVWIPVFHDWSNAPGTRWFSSDTPWPHYFADEILPAWYRYGRTPPVLPDDWIMLFEDAQGWPMKSMWCGFRIVDNSANSWETVWGIKCANPDFSRFFGSDDPLLSLEFRILPLRPIWPAFLINTIFYAGLCAILILGPGVIRQHIRVRRKCCPACAYPAGTSPVCTECGKSLPVQSRKCG